MPVYNGADFIRQAIQSILAQDFGDFELIVSDNASTDETEAICRGFADNDTRIRYERNDVNIGAAGNYNKVFRSARGEYFKWAAHDDECHPAMLRRCVGFLDESTDSVAMVYPRAELIDDQGQTLVPGLDRIECRDPRPHRRLAHLLWTLNYCDPVFGLIKSEFLLKTQLIGRYFGADYVLLGELAMIGELRELDEILFRLRAHSRRSMKANPGARARATWYDPAAARKRFILPDWERMVWEMLKSVRESQLPPTEKAKCYMTVPGMHYWRRFRSAGGRVKKRVKEFAGGLRAVQERAKKSERNLKPALGKNANPSPPEKR
jgi:glycosyltransferase involved in cell wall biosynthesis